MKSDSPGNKFYDEIIKLSPDIPPIIKAQSLKSNMDIEAPYLNYNDFDISTGRNVGGVSGSKATKNLEDDNTY